MDQKLTVKVYGEYEISDLEEELIFLKNIPIRAIPVGEGTTDLEVHYSGRNVNVYPKSNSIYRYDLFGNINHCKISTLQDRINLTRLNNDKGQTIKSSYSFYYDPKNSSE